MKEEYIELNPCPFCGGEVSMALAGCGTINWVFITRGRSKTKKNCNCRLFMESERYFINCMDSAEAAKRARKELAEKWNSIKSSAAVCGERKQK